MHFEAALSLRKAVSKSFHQHVGGTMIASCESEFQELDKKIKGRSLHYAFEI